MVVLLLMKNIIVLIFFFFLFRFTLISSLMWLSTSYISEVWTLCFS